MDNRIAKDYMHRLGARELSHMTRKAAREASIAEFNVLDEMTKSEVLNWIENRLSPSNRPYVNSYWLKHQCEQGLTRRYLSCAEMRGALLLGGYTFIRDTNSTGWFFNVSLKSPLFTVEPDNRYQPPQECAGRYWDAFHAAVKDGKTDRQAFDDAIQAALFPHKAGRAAHDA